MDRAKDDRLNESRDELLDSKDRLRAAARAIDPLRPLREHPLVTVAAATAVGAAAASPKLASMLRTASAGIVGRFARRAAAQIAQGLARRRAARANPSSEDPAHDKTHSV